MKILFSILFLVLITSCGISTLSPNNHLWVQNVRKSKLVKKEYSYQPLIFKNYIYFRDSIIQYQRQELSLSNEHQDSILKIVINNLSKLDSNIIFLSDQINVADNEIKRIRPPVRARKINKNIILNHIKDSATYIFPIIYTEIIRSYTITGGYTFSYRTYSGSDNIAIIIYIVDKKKIIYKRSVRYFAKHKEHETDVNKYESTMKPEYWDLIVQKAMEDYIKRIKKE